MHESAGSRRPNGEQASPLRNGGTVRQSGDLPWVRKPHGCLGVGWRLWCGHSMGGFGLEGTEMESKIAADRQGNIWWADWRHSEIGRMSPTGQTEVFPVAGSVPISIVAGPDGRMWYTDPPNRSIDAITFGGDIQTYQLPSEKNSPSGLTVGPDTH